MVHLNPVPNDDDNEQQQPPPQKIPDPPPRLVDETQQLIEAIGDLFDSGFGGRPFRRDIAALALVCWLDSLTREFGSGRLSEVATGEGREFLLETLPKQLARTQQFFQQLTIFVETSVPDPRPDGDEGGE